MNLYFWMQDQMTGRAAPGDALQVAQSRASTFLLGHWFETNKEDVLGGKPVWIKVARIRPPDAGYDVRIMSVRQVRHLGSAEFIGLWNWSSSVYKLLYLPHSSEATGHFAIDIYHGKDSPYERWLANVRWINFSSRYKALYEHFKSAAVVLGQPLMVVEDPDGILDFEQQLLHALGSTRLSP